ncbi:hypothetical protein OHV05_33535 [Kitasatospora sp. NBC_00070]|uniref:hypothetical protein n=1 Tax=Kitasatospora sp. NBC_00070 TaxID=2975962 RepID=UPI00324A2657
MFILEPGILAMTVLGLGYAAAPAAISLAARSARTAERRHQARRLRAILYLHRTS